MTTPGDEETTDVAGTPAAHGAETPATGLVPTGETTPTAPNGVRKESIAQAVVIGVKDAGRPVVGFLDSVGGHLIMIARALSWLPRPPYRARNYVDSMEY